jgi:precorrin-6B methylase 2
MADLADISAGERAVDLGSGDGRVVIALARKGADAHGYEINPALVLLSLRNIRRAGLSGRAHIHWGSFWRADLSGFHAVTVFQGSFVMRRLERKVLRELPDGARVVSDYWRFPTLPAESVAGTLHRYRMGPRELRGVSG